ncbi:hypothetical protein EVG20_g4415 [Dentipellis fragilis]|uniref:GTP-binding protein n=1 Tax=Dentipellis fragilis TaxID=205917 RepID=A0A4Y9YVR0_9AGAM|nr:hypothetical protein EVG20_g4415 [Dentipellis fragilis]
MKKKVLLMGASGSGKTSMRSLIFSNNPASLTSRLGATIDVEQNHVRFLGDLILNLWDCGGQDAFMDSYLTTQRSTIFQHVGVLIYVFEIESRDMSKDLLYYRDCLDALRKYSPDAAVFLLVHKMDLVTGDKRAALEKKRRELQHESGDVDVTVFGTSIYDESLYKAWSRIVHAIIPNAAVLTKHLTTFAETCNATEAILFERTTFLVIATSATTRAPPSPSNAYSALTSPNSNSTTTTTVTTPNGTNTDPGANVPVSAETADSDPHELSATRYERTSELIKALKHACSRVREEFHVLEMELPEFTAVLDEMTKNTYVLLVVHDPSIGASCLVWSCPVACVGGRGADGGGGYIETAALKINIRLARKKFEELQSSSVVS